MPEGTVTRVLYLKTALPKHKGPQCVLDTSYSSKRTTPITNKKTLDTPEAIVEFVVREGAGVVPLSSSAPCPLVLPLLLPPPPPPPPSPPSSVALSHSYSSFSSSSSALLSSSSWSASSTRLVYISSPLDCGRGDGLEPLVDILLELPADTGRRGYMNCVPINIGCCCLAVVPIEISVSL